MSTRQLALLTCLLVLGPGGCRQGPSPVQAPRASPTATSGTREPIPITLGYAALRISVPVFVALEQNLFEKHGLRVAELQRFETAQPMIDALVAGHVPIAGYAALPISFAAQARSKVRLLYLTEILEDQEHPFSYLIVKADSPLRSLADLAGKRVGILPTLAYRVWLRKILADEGVEGVILQDVSPGLQAQALESGLVDALWTNDPAATAVLGSGKGRLLVKEALVPKHFGEPFLFGSFNVREDYAREHPEVVRRLAAALDEAIAFTMNDPAAARRAMRPYVLEEHQPFVDDYADPFYRTTADSRPEAFQAIQELYAELSIIPGPLDLKGLVYRAPAAEKGAGAPQAVGGFESARRRPSGRLRGTGYSRTVRPPSTASTWPVTKPAEAR